MEIAQWKMLKDVLRHRKGAKSRVALRSRDEICVTRKISRRPKWLNRRSKCLRRRKVGRRPRLGHQLYPVRLLMVSQSVHNPNRASVLQRQRRESCYRSAAHTLPSLEGRFTTLHSMRKRDYVKKRNANFRMPLRTGMWKMTLV